MPPSGAAGHAPKHRGEHNSQDIREVAEGRKEGRRRAGHHKAGPPLRQQLSDSEGLRRRSRTAYIAAMPGWKRDVGRRLDALIVRTVPGVRKTVKWNSPFYGVGSGVVPRHPLFCEVRQSSFLSGHFAASYPARRVQAKEVRYPDIHEDDQLDEAQVAAWVKEASQLPGKQM